jgi:hypothetical protein
MRTVTDMQKFEFTLLLSAPSSFPTSDQLDVLFDAGCDDALFGRTAGVAYADFVREGATFSEAVMSAIRGIEQTIPGVRISRVEPDDYVTVTDISKRTGWSREYVRLLVLGKRGTGFFPPPLTRLGNSRNRIWRWSEVSRWLVNHHGAVIPGISEYPFIAALNSMLELRDTIPALDDNGREEIADMLSKEHESLRLCRTGCAKAG